MIDLNHRATLRQEFSDSITAHIDRRAPLEVRAATLKRIIAELEASPPEASERPGRSVSASAVGDECARRVQYGIWPTFHPDAPIPKRAPLSIKTRIVFARGHATEPVVAEWMRDAGFGLSTSRATEDGEARQHGFAVAGGQIKGFADGIILLSPIPLPRRVIWEHKTIQDKGFRGAVRHGVVKYYPRYDAQVQLLMPYMDAEATLFSLLNADTGALYFELDGLDTTRAQAVSDRAVWILRATRAGELLPKVRADGEGFPCSFCDFKEECWG